jgi:cyclic pyranopterin phosphate synthase
MVDVTGKAVTVREAVACGEIVTRSETIRLIRDQRIPKGNVLEAARVAGIMAAKETARLIPLCHPLNPTGIDVAFTVGDDHIGVEARVRLPGRTGAEMEALTAVSVALLTIYDMCKAVDKGMVIGNIRLVKKTGGKSREFVRKED